MLQLQILPLVLIATDAEVMALIETRKLYGRGIGYIDCHLLASALISNTPLWTTDKRLHETAVELNIAA